MSIAVRNAVLHIGSKLRAGVDAKAIVADGLKGLNPTEVQQVVDSFQRQLGRIGPEYFQSVFGLSKETLLSELKTHTRGTGGNGALNYLHAQRRQTVMDVERFIASPRPGEEMRDLVSMLGKDRGIARHGLDNVAQLADRLVRASLPIEAAIAAFDKTGESGPSAQTLRDVQTGGAVDDAWLKSMLRSTGKTASELAQFMSAPSRFDTATRIDKFFDDGEQHRAQAALRSMQEQLAANGGREIMMEHTVPSADRMTREDASHIVHFELNDVRLEESDGRFTIAAQYFSDKLSPEQVTKALEIMIGAYGTELRANKGAWIDEPPEGAAVCPIPFDENHHAAGF